QLAGLAPGGPVSRREYGAPAAEQAEQRQPHQSLPCAHGEPRPSVAAIPRPLSPERPPLSAEKPRFSRPARVRRVLQALRPARTGAAQAALPLSLAKPASCRTDCQSVLQQCRTPA